ncbi:MAG: bifunctional phosphopantothenoylcysteine decarboxylase/phosphopantothenate--cysteine ligase CoaBC [Blastocatellia bacterium]|nr:bifunctional phosphopantothenoylcysteine decarboxylase/phosphopantothenate--cysteine ligase CoaBC [Blastocatellia bacterium]MCS7156834.1 bifunctional phosphopantothenoylcysteine decarboxylase/phosphopantothenate--cysteine ligase CoaBC [Blastocatellia bacterium]MCX7752792.1 bifunctional phosphopantothenoylcysteine decarboxylase/phosphopantothenate--cysteine ligase CoaBC [Blastocatellia bacterium]MDW8167525.1 bifunctional phosphopantothenoylcysteine decarboxylase/phosphopantothenate--cysteine l
MSPDRPYRVVLGVTGGIAAYKAPEILRQLQQRGAEVRVVLTRAATRFIGRVTFEALSRHPVIVEMFEPDVNVVVRHVEMARWADLLLVAPVTAHTLARFAHGLADDFLTTLYLSARCPVLLAPAMDAEMWENAATQENLARLRQRGIAIIPPERGYLASGVQGEGRLAEPEQIVARALVILAARPYARDLEGERVLITAGPTCEDLDPIRYLTNRSTGKMGYALAHAALARGAQVTLISGPTTLLPPPDAETIFVRCAEEMYRAVLSHMERATIIIKAAAVADYRPAAFSPTKLKKAAAEFQLALEPTPDILAELGRRKGSRVLVGFAAETEAHLEYGRRKLIEKNLDFILVNDVASAETGFAAEENAGVLLDRDGNALELPRMSKYEMAMRILDRVRALLAQRQRAQEIGESARGFPASELRKADEG